MKKKKSTIEIIEEAEKNGKVCFMTVDGLYSANLVDFLEQPTEGLLYDLNRDKVTVLSWISADNPKWENDYAVSMVIEFLHKFYLEHKESN